MDDQELGQLVGSAIRELREEFEAFRIQVQQQAERFESLASAIEAQGAILVALVETLRADSEIISDDQGRAIGVRKKLNG